MRRTIAALFLAALLAPSLRADEKVANFALLYDLDSTSIIYCRVTGENGDPFGTPIRATQRLKTSGSSATVVSNVASSGAFALVSVGQILVVDTGVQTTQTRVVTAKASADSITVNAAVDWSAGFGFGFVNQTCGSTAADGWINMDDRFDERTIHFHLGQINGVTGGIDVRVECKDGFLDAQPIRVYPTTSSTDCGGGTTAGGFCNFTTAGITTGDVDIQVVEPHRACRVGMLIHTSETAESVEADNERITIGLTLVNAGKK
jgi:hypothetical protein